MGIILNYQSYDLSVTDSITGATINSTFSYNDATASNYQSGWETESTRIVITIDNTPIIEKASTRIRLMDCLLLDKISNDFIRFRIAVEDSGKLFHYIALDHANIKDRETSSSGVRITSVNVNVKGDTHIILSPFSSFRESTNDISDFSYPLETVYYKRQSVYNNEDFYCDFQCSDPEITPYLSIIPVYKYHKVWVLIITRHIADYMSTLTQVPFIDVTASGIISEITDTLRIYLGI